PDAQAEERDQYRDEQQISEHGSLVTLPTRGAQRLDAFYTSTLAFLTRRLRRHFLRRLRRR
ncbi:MAG TPA: hypothetical protein VGZ52_01020, partial [Acidimicrobiales bacterium]|nr:hypothetical protein [Acidimicrobiales bacterium]